MITTSQTEYASIKLTVNGKSVERRVATHRRLLDFLRDELDLTGAKEVCGEGECGACTILLDGQAVNSCLIFAMEADGRDVMTIEGLGNTLLHRKLIQAFIDHHAVQCGYCIPGMVLSAEELLRKQESPTRDEIKRSLAGNICRCTGYRKIIDAVEAASGTDT